MGGIGLGSVALPRLVPRSWHPLKVYAGLELSIGVIGLILLVALPRVQTVYLSAVGYGLGGVLLRAVVCIGCLLPPTMLMGATLPAVARWTGATRTGVAQTSLLYAANTIGAVAGVLIAGFYLLRLHDTVVTTLVAVGLNGTVKLRHQASSDTHHLGPRRASTTISCRSITQIFLNLTIPFDVLPAAESPQQRGDGRVGAPFVDARNRLSAVGEAQRRFITVVRDV